MDWWIWGELFWRVGEERLYMSVVSTCSVSPSTSQSNGKAAATFCKCSNSQSSVSQERVLYQWERQYLYIFGDTFAGKKYWRIVCYLRLLSCAFSLLMRRERGGEGTCRPFRNREDKPRVNDSTLTMSLVCIIYSCLIISCWTATFKQIWMSLGVARYQNALFRGGRGFCSYLKHRLLLNYGEKGFLI